MSRSPRQRRKARERAASERQQRIDGTDPVLAAVDPLWERPLRVMLLGRTNRRIDGGLGRSVRMIVEALQYVGNEAWLENCNQPLSTIGKPDVVWHYGDEDHIDQQRELARSAGAAFLVNSQYDGSDESGSVVARAKTALRHGDHLVVFTDAARDAVVGLLQFAQMMHGEDPPVRPRVVVAPKTIRDMSTYDASPHLTERRGICIGELAKLRRHRLLLGWRVEDVIEALRRVLPDEPILTYGQYTTDDHVPFEGTTNIPKPGDEMNSFLCSLRLFVCLTAGETFSMVPAEAQSAGVPVIYRPMVQSLTQHLGITGVRAESPEEVALGAYRLLSSPKRWHDYSNAGRFNFASRAIPTAGRAIDMELRRLLLQPSCPSQNI